MKPPGRPLGICAAPKLRLERATANGDERPTDSRVLQDDPAEEPYLGDRVQGARQHHDQDGRGAEGEHRSFSGVRVEVGTKASTRLLDAHCDDSQPATGDSEDQTGT